MRGWVAAGLLAGLFVGCTGTIGDDSNIDEGTVGSGLCADSPTARRLTVTEYVATVQALLRVDISSEAVEALPADLRLDGFSNTATSLIATDVHVEQFDVLGQLAVSRIGDLGDFVSGLGVTCSDLTPACAREVSQAIASLLFRQPAIDAEVDELAKIFVAVEAENESFELGVQLVLEATLQSPRFLYRVEDEHGDADIRLIDGYAMANRLSYLLWSAPPDDDLFAAAKSDALRTDEQVEAQVRRMLADPRAKDTSRLYVADWLNLDRLDNLPRDSAVFPTWTPALGEAMRDETLAFADHLIWELNAPLLDLFTSQTTFVTPELATHYGLDAPGADGQVDLSDVPERGGILTQGGMVTIGGSTASMVTRGLHMMETFLCGEIGDPPSGVDTTPVPAEPGVSNRAVSETRVENPSCGGCHQRFEPMAWGLERFDGTGAYSETDSFENDLQQDGLVRFGGEDVPFSTIAELGAILGESDVVKECMATKASQFALGRPVAHDETVSCSLDAVRLTFIESGGTYEDLMVAVALSPMFRQIYTQ